MLAASRDQATRSWSIGAILALLLVPALQSVTSISPAAANGYTAPTPNLLFQLQKQNRARPWLRVAMDSSRLALRVGRIDEDGLTGLRSHTPDRAVPTRIAWSEIARIDEITTRAHQGRMVGFLVAGLAGAGLGNMIGAAHGQGKSDALIGLAAFGSLGAWQGGRFGERFVRDRPWYVAAPAVASLAVRSPTAIDAPAETTLASRTPGNAQEPPPVLAASSLSSSPSVLRACQRLNPEHLLRIRGDFGQFQGFAGVIGPQGMDRLRTSRFRRGLAVEAAPPGLVTWDRIERVEKRGRSVGAGALGGGVALGLLGGLVAAAAVSVADGAEEPTTAALEGAAAGGAVGAVLGGLIGAAIPRWQLVYKRH